MKILFLDVDGVTCTRRSHLTYGREGGVWNDWDPLACAAIRRACEKGVRIVVSSTWRKPVNVVALEEQMKLHGLWQYLFEGDWKTPVTDKQKDYGERVGSFTVSACGRGQEIQMWLDAHKEIQNYRILDDDSDMLDHQKPHFIHTHGEEGMTSTNIKQLLNWAGALKS